MDIKVEPEFIAVNAEPEFIAVNAEPEFIAVNTVAQTSPRHDYMNSSTGILVKEESCEFNDCALADMKQEELNIKDEDTFSSTILKVNKVTEKMHKNIEKQKGLQESFQCNVCNKTIPTKRGLRKHLKIHTGVKPHSCNMCDFKCIRKSQLTDHLRRHTGEKPHNCTFCSKKFAHASDLSRHIRIHTGQTPYSCTFCDYKCNTKPQLKYHLISHTGEKPYTCTVCDYKCIRAADLKVHLTKHSEEKLHRCTFCDHKCKTRRHLRYHLKVHTGKKYNCDYCGYNSIDQWNLQKHLKTHDTDGQLSCVHCTCKFSSKTLLISHLRTHKEETNAESASTRSAQNKSDNDECLNNFSVKAEPLPFVEECEDEYLSNIKEEPIMEEEN